MPWKIVRWSREQGRGAIASEHFENVVFDASCCDVDDFRIGEPVHITTEVTDIGVRVTRLWPDDPRFKTNADTMHVPMLLDDKQLAMSKTLTSVKICSDHRVCSLSNGDLVIEGDDNSFEYGATQKLTFAAVHYLDLPVYFEPKYIRLSTDAERAHLHTHKLALDPTMVTITIVEATDVEMTAKFYFIVCDSLHCSRGPHSR